MIILCFTKFYDLLISGVLTIMTLIIVVYIGVSDANTVTVGGLLLLQACALLTIFSIIRIIAKYRIFKHENIPYWKAFIPFYAEYTLCKLTGTNVTWSFLELAPLIINIIYSVIEFLYSKLSSFPYSSYIYTDSISNISILVFAILLGKIVYSYILAKNITKKFGKKENFKWKIFFLPIIYYMKVVSNEPEKKEIDYSNQFTPNVNKTSENNINITNPNQPLNNQSYTNNIPPLEENNLNNK